MLDKRFWPWTCHGRWMSDEFEPALVSVVIPSYNRAQFLVEAMDSVWTQTYRPIELIVVDDGSTDSTRQAVAEWGRKPTGDKHLKLRYFFQENRGAPGARNLGLVESRGEFIQFFDSDDLLHPDKLTRQVAALNDNPKLDFVYSGTAKFEDKPDWNSEAYCGRPSERLLPDFITKPLWCVASGVYRRRACVANGPWHEGLVQQQDWEYHVRFCARKPVIAYVPGVLSAFRVHAHGRIADLNGSRKALENRLLVTQSMETAMRATLQMDRNTVEALTARYFVLAYSCVLGGHDYLANVSHARGFRICQNVRQRCQLETIRVVKCVPMRCRPMLFRSLKRLKQFVDVLCA